MSGSLDEYLNLDMLAPSTGAQSDDSPESTFLGLPPTPPQATLDNVPAVGQQDFQDLFKFYFDDTLDKMAVAPVSSADASSFSFFNDSLSPPEPSSSSATSASPALADDVNFFAIDPQLMSAPQPSTHSRTRSSVSAAGARNSKARVSSVSIADDEDDEDEDEDEDMDDMDDLIAPVKLGGRGKNARKGTVLSGGVKKFGGQAVRDTNDPEDWRPTVDEYKKMSSKEKRQLRNKISARNFRVRRKGKPPHPHHKSKALIIPYVRVHHHPRGRRRRP